MKLTNRNAWDTYAGGISAASGKNAYRSRTTIGEYSIQPISSVNNCERHLGYQVDFLNILGKLGGGLWQDLGFTNLRKAMSVCQEHMKNNNGEYVSGGPSAE